ncbi:hypothetical protein TNCT_260721 [Trichonephila clavata]|uniref:Uncharacterized protein n=1 Tax=Trichonephila clavata TaxID=2740835 RepID=A0A8X6GIJ7_TRICU|nr:hypothetical protein TNCT_260721 [Trichonephila clavata]
MELGISIPYQNHPYLVFDVLLKMARYFSSINDLLRCQESQMSYSGRDSAMSDMSNPRLGERQLSLDELKVTVL